MNSSINHERILIAVALALCAGIMCYNFFFVPSVLPPTVIYADKPKSDFVSEDSESVNTASEGVSDDGQVSDYLININTATVEEMADALPRVGKSVAQRIVEYRNKNGPFKKIDEIKNVKGIGEKTFEKMRDMICV